MKSSIFLPAAKDKLKDRLEKGFPIVELELTLPVDSNELIIRLDKHFSLNFWFLDGALGDEEILTDLFTSPVSIWH